MNENILNALKAYKKEKGRFWKSSLKNAWSSGIYDVCNKDNISYLQQARNLDIKLENI